MSRCIIKSCELAEQPISKEDFASKFSHLFDKKKFGLLTVDAFCTIVKKLGLCDSVLAVRDINPLKAPLRSGRSGNSRKIFVLTDKTPDGRHALYLYHCRLALGLAHQSSDPTKEAILLFSPFENGTEQEVYVSFDELEQQLVHFLVLQP